MSEVDDAALSRLAAAGKTEVRVELPLRRVAVVDFLAGHREWTRKATLEWLLDIGITKVLEEARLLVRADEGNPTMPDQARAD